MQRKILLFISILLIYTCHAQNDSVHFKRRNVIWFTPSGVNQINGVAIGPLESLVLKKCNQTVNGITLNLIGVGILMPLIPYDPNDDNFDKLKSDTAVFKGIDDEIKNSSHAEKSDTHNGIVLSLAGAVTGKVNGIYASGFCAMTGEVKGLVMAPFMNISFHVKGVSIGGFNSVAKMKGLQIGIINKAANLKGLQIGIWNRTRKRKMPLFNWG